MLSLTLSHHEHSKMKYNKIEDESAQSSAQKEEGIQDGVQSNPNDSIASQKLKTVFLM